MCDCYGHPCKVCGKIIPTHIMDFITPRDNVEAFCGRHIPKTGRIYVYVLTATEEGHRKGSKMGFSVINAKRVCWKSHRKANDRFNRAGGLVYKKPLLKDVVTPNMWSAEEITEV